MIIHKDSHVDHGLTEEQKNYLLELFKDRNSFFIETVELPAHLGTVPCGLHGPIMGDPPVVEALVGIREPRPYTSRLVNRPTRPTNKVTVIAGPHYDHPCVMYTAFGGPLTPKEVGDPSHQPDVPQASIDFWAQHALSAQ